MVILYQLNRAEEAHRHLHANRLILLIQIFSSQFFSVTIFDQEWHGILKKWNWSLKFCHCCRLKNLKNSLVWKLISFVDLYLEKKCVSFVVSKCHSRKILAFIQSIENHLHLWQGSFNRKFFRASYNLFRQFFFSFKSLVKIKTNWFFWLIKCSRIFRWSILAI